MPEIKNTFHLGAINTDSNERFVQPGEILSAENVLFDGVGNDGVASEFNSAIGLLYLTEYITDKINLSFTDMTIRGHAKWQNKVYLIFTGKTSALTNKVIIQEFDSVNKTFELVLVTDAGFLTSNRQITTQADVINGEYLYYTFGEYDGGVDELTPFSTPKRFHIERAKSDPSGYTDNYDLNNILPRPDAPVMYVENTYSSLNQSFKNTDGNYAFAVRYKTIDEAWTPLGYRTDFFTVLDNPYTPSGYPHAANTELNIFHIEISNVMGVYDGDSLLEAELYLVNQGGSMFLVGKKDVTTTTSVIDFTIKSTSFKSILDQGSANTINYELPYLTGTQAIVNSSVVYGNLDLPLPSFNDRNIEINHTVVGNSGAIGFRLSSGTITSNSGTILNGENMTIDALDGSNLIGGILKCGVGVTEASIYVKHFTRDEVAAELQSNFRKLIDQNITVVAATSPSTNITVSNIPTSYNGEEIYVDIYDIASINLFEDTNLGLVFYDEYGRNIGVTNITKASIDNDLKLTSAGVIVDIPDNVIDPPSWASSFSIAKTKPFYIYEYWYQVAGSSITINTVEYHAFETKGYSTEMLRSVPTPKKDTRKTDSREEEIERYDSNTVSLFSVEHRTFAEGTILPTTDVISGGGDVKYVYMSGGFSASQYQWAYKVPVAFRQINAKDAVFYESSKFDISEFPLKNTWVNSYDTINQPYTIQGYVKPSELKSVETLYRPFTIQDLLSLSGRSTGVNSQLYSPSSNYNGLGVFSSQYLNYYDFPEENGSIKRLVNLRGNLLVIQNSKWSLSQTNKDSVMKGFMSQPQEYSTPFGVGDPESVAIIGDNVYAVDGKNGVVLRLGQSGVEVLNRGMSYEIKEDFTNFKGRIYGGWDPVLEAYVFAPFDDTLKETGDTWVYSSKLKSVTTRFSDGGYFFYANGEMFGFGNFTDGNINTPVDQLMLHRLPFTGSTGKNAYNTSLTKEQSFSFVVNQHPSIVKTFEAITIEGTEAVELTLETSLGHTGTISASTFKLREGVWYADIPLSKGVTGEPFKGYWMKVTATGSFKEIFSITTRIAPSSNSPEK